MEIKNCFDYTPIISKVKDEVDGGFYAGRYLEFPEARTHGETYEELEKNMEEVLELAIDCRLKNKDQMPQPFERGDFTRKYPIYLKETEENFYVYVPGWDIHTQGESVEDVIEMAKDAIGLMWLEYEEEGLDIPNPKLDFILEDFDIKKLVGLDFDIKTFVGLDIEKYKKDYEKVYKNYI